MERDAAENAIFSLAAIRPAQAYYHDGLREFILPYDAVRTAENPRSNPQPISDEHTKQPARTVAGTDPHWRPTPACREYLVQCLGFDIGSLPTNVAGRAPVILR